MSIDTILPYVTLGSAVLMIIAILLQQRGASLGADSARLENYSLLVADLIKTCLT